MGLREKALEMALKQNKTLKKIGTLHSLTIDTSVGKIVIEMGLKGEPYPIQFEALYEIRSLEGKTTALISNITCEKEWISQVLAIWIENNGPIKQELPGMVGGFAKIFF